MVSSLEDAAEGPEPMQEAELMQEAEETFDNDLDQVVFPDGMSSGAIDDETAEETDTRDSVLQREIQDFQPDAIMDSLQESQDYGMGELPPDYPEDFGRDDFGSESAEAGTEEAGEAEREKAAANADYARIKAEAGETEYVSLPANDLFRKIGFPVREKQPPDPVALASSVLGAAIVYKAAEDYTLILRMLWSGGYEGRALYSLIVSKWELETFIGSGPYWMYTSISPCRILDQCWDNAVEQEKDKIRRTNRRIAAGTEGGDGM